MFIEFCCAFAWAALMRASTALPPKLVSVLVALHETVLVEFEVDGVSKTLMAIIGVKQGDLLGPELFIYFIAAIMESWRNDPETSYEMCEMLSRPDFVLTGRKSSADGDPVEVPDSEYADDTGVPICSRLDVEEQTPRLLLHFSRWGMEVHAGLLDSAGTVIKGSKSEVLFCSAAPSTYADASTFDGADLSHILLPAGAFMPVVEKFPYLGDFLSRSCSDACAVDYRIETAGKAFGALRSCLFASTFVSAAAKRVVYEGIILLILLYGSESWCLFEVLLQRLRVFHAQCLRAMCRVTRKHTWDLHISTQELGQRLGLDSIDMYVSRRQLRWLGHVSRMDYSRLPRRMLSSWVAHARPRGAPHMTYGRSINKALAKFGISPAWWPELAADRGAWRETLRSGFPPPSFRPSLPPPPEPISKTKPPRRAAARALLAIGASLARE